MEGLFRLVCEIALIAGVVAQRILTALATSIATGVFQLIDNVVGVCVSFYFGEDRQRANGALSVAKIVLMCASRRVRGPLKCTILC